MAFSQILGQDKAQRLLTRARASGRLAHAYLFTGPAGVGKKTLAKDFATSLLCQHPKTDGSSCGTCSSCMQMRSGSHPDFLKIAPDGQHIKINQIREMKETLVYPPLEGSLRVVLMHDVQTMRREAANSLLKILEEPPARNLLLLTGENEAGILDTIRSRCQIIPLHALPLGLCTELIARHRPHLSSVDCHTLSELSYGCPGQALQMEAEALLPLYNELIENILALAKPMGRRVENALILAERLGKDKEMLAHIFHLLRLLYKNILAYALSGKDEYLPQGYHNLPREHWNQEQLSAKLKAIGMAEVALARNCTPSLTLEVLLLQLMDCLDPHPMQA